MTYPGDVTDPTQSNCYPYSAFRFYNNVGNNVLSARPISPPTDGTFANNVTLCPSYSGSTFKDITGKTYNIGCDQTVGGNDLYATVAKTLEGCLTYCSTYSACVAVTFTGYPVQNNAANCYPKSSYGTASSSGGIQYAQLVQ